ncbi:MAG: hypothetical protein HC875_30570 [Anaerolineales bacterium]|nr:hypothetical protein [Anaerolineales bacterium]
MISVTSFLVYVNAKLLTQQSNSLNGFTALLLFLSQPLVFSYVGATYADLTVMMMVTLGVAIYLIAYRSTRYRAWLLLSLGVVLFMALKSKETSICLGILLLGLGFVDGKFNSSQFFKDIGFVAAGIAVSIVIFMVLNHFILGEMWFGWRPSDFTTLLSFNLRTNYARPESSWYDYVLTTSLLAPFFLYLVNFARSVDNSPFSIKVIWLLPLVIILFLSISMIKGLGESFPVIAFIYSPS